MSSKDPPPQGRRGPPEPEAGPRLLLRSGAEGLVGHSSLHLLKAGGDDGDLHLVLVALVKGGAPDDGGVGVGGLVISLEAMDTSSS